MNATSYSQAESKVLQILDKGKPLTTGQIADRFYKTRRAKRPEQWRRSITVIINSLRRKASAKREKFKIVSTEFSGPIEMQHWVEK